MNESKRTGIFVVLGLVALVAAYLARPAAPVRQVDDSGERFFAEANPLDARSLEIVSFDEETARTNAFKVAQVDGTWRIPSHENYPADAETQLAKAAASVIDLVKGPKVSDLAADHALYGVVDPADDGGAAAESVGTRVTMQNASGATMVDFIIGKPLKSQRNVRYVRVPGRDRVYTATVDTSDLSTDFEDWIKPDLLDIEVEDIASLIVNAYTIDEARGKVVPGEVVDLTHDATDSSWTAADLAATERVRTAAIDGLKQALGDLEIIDVHRKPEGLSRELRETESLRLDQAAVMSLSQRGFYIADGGLYSNQGETTIALNNGVRYVLRFGEIARTHRGNGFDDAADSIADELLSEEEEGSARYLFLMAEFDQTLIPVPAYVPDIEFPEVPEGEEGPTEEERAEIVQSIADENKRLEQVYRETMAEGQAQVAALNERFADWYFVIADDVYQKLRFGRADVVEGIPAGE